jgi:predicted PhzF superfamily epimerase YddE/YHI9
MLQVDAFAADVFGGNPAAVFVLDDWPSDGLMQAIAEENNLAETAFVRREAGMFGIRWFTPVHEAAFCGHATLAAAHALATEHGVKGPMLFRTEQVGEIRVATGPEGYSLDLPAYPPEPLNPHRIPAELFPSGFQACFRNFENLFVELADEAMVRTYRPDAARIAGLFPAGLCITARGSGGVDFVSRYFAPGAGIPEDPVTGSTHATLVPYWAERLGRSALRAHQASRRGGDLACEHRGGRVMLTGRAATYMRATIHVPDHEG